VHLKARFAMTLVDLSGEMLAVSRRFNPECEHLQGDMRTVRLGRAFDAVFVHDAVDYNGGTDAPDGRGVRFLDWVWDPDPGDSWVLTEYAFLLRDADGSVRVVHETHRTGLFGREVWLRLLAGAGFEPSAVTEETTEERTPRELFVGRRPSPWALRNRGPEARTGRSRRGR
jgi:hypothetical protein